VFDISWYNTQFRNYTTAMKSIDPTILMVGPAVTGGWENWILAFYQENGDIVDVISWHWYPNGHEMSPEDALSTPVDIEEQVTKIRNWWIDPEINPKGYQRPIPPLLLGEYSITWASGLRIPLATQVGAIWVAETIGHMANIGVEMGAHFSLMGSPAGTRWHGLVDPLQQIRPVYGIFQIYKEWGTTQIKVESPDPQLLPVFASIRDDKSLAILKINKDFHQNRTEKLTFSGIIPNEEATILQLVEGIPQAFEVDPVLLDSDFSYTFPSTSITLFLIKPITHNIKWLLLGILLGLLLLGFLVINHQEKQHSR